MKTSVGIPADCIPGNGYRVLEITSGPDGQGRQSFTMYWRGYNPSTLNAIRAQCFFAVVKDHKRDGDRIVDRTV